MKPSKVVECLKDTKKVMLISTTSVQRINISEMENVKVDLGEEVVEYDYKGLHYVLDMTDINMIIMNPNEMEINGLSIP